MYIIFCHSVPANVSAKVIEAQLEYATMSLEKLSVVAHSLIVSRILYALPSYGEAFCLLS